MAESELHLDLALEKQERLSKEMSKKMENKKLFDETEFSILYLQEYIHSKEESVKKVEDMVQSAGLDLVFSPFISMQVFRLIIIIEIQYVFNFY